MLPGRGLQSQPVGPVSVSLLHAAGLTPPFPRVRSETAICSLVWGGARVGKRQRQRQEQGEGHGRAIPLQCGSFSDSIEPHNPRSANICSRGQSDAKGAKCISFSPLINCECFLATSGSSNGPTITNIGNEFRSKAMLDCSPILAFGVFLPRIAAQSLSLVRGGSSEQDSPDVM